MKLGGRMTNPGELRTKVTLVVPTLAKDAGGAQVPSWSNFGTSPNVYAKIKYAHGPESVNSDAQKISSKMTITIRYRNDVNATHGILLDGELWKFISSPDDIENRHEYLEIQAELVKGSI